FSPIGEEDWQSAAILFHPQVSPPTDLITTVEGNRIRISGIMRNPTPLAVKEAKIIGILSTQNDREVFAAQTIIENLSAFGEKPFTIIFPEDKELARTVDLKVTKVYVSVK
ncbi:hypothetical protein HY967_00180, partial [Candidatus Jorgensenbacteria bacterium]|nr:hypothetical protein [Candidatus Jorgensenbacteria bacterium]